MTRGCASLGGRGWGVGSNAGFALKKSSARSVPEIEDTNKFTNKFGSTTGTLDGALGTCHITLIPQINV